jgi:hypothetical protein
MDAIRPHTLQKNEIGYILKSVIVWDITPCSQTTYRKKYNFHLQERKISQSRSIVVHLASIGSRFSADYTALCPRRGNTLQIPLRELRIQLVPYDAVDRNKVSIRQLVFIFFLSHYMFRPLQVRYTIECFNGLFLIQRIRCTYAT